MKKYLVNQDYGVGSVWVYVVAENKQAIINRFINVKIYDHLPSELMGSEEDIPTDDMEDPCFLDTYKYGKIDSFKEIPENIKSFLIEFFDSEGWSYELLPNDKKTETIKINFVLGGYIYLVLNMSMYVDSKFMLIFPFAWEDDFENKIRVTSYYEKKLVLYGCDDIKSEVKKIIMAIKEQRVASTGMKKKDMNIEWSGLTVDELKTNLLKKWPVI